MVKRVCIVGKRERISKVGGDENGRRDVMS